MATAREREVVVDKTISEVNKGVGLRVPVIEIEEDDVESLSDSDSRARLGIPGRPKEKNYEDHAVGPRTTSTTAAALSDLDDLERGTGHEQYRENGVLHKDGPVLVLADDDEDEDEEDSEDENDIWDRESLIEATLDQLEEAHILATSDESTTDTCTVDESIMYRKLLRRVGIDEFIRQTLEIEGVSAKKLCSAFGLRIPFLEGRPDEAYYRVLGLAIQRELQKREKLEQWNTLDDAVHLLQRAKNVIVVTGAGISTSLGIPDFRSKHNGLYARLEHLGLSDPQEVFDIGLFREDPTIFFSVAKDILPETKKYTPTHAFIKMLQDRGKLLVNYTQNIDNIEDHAGIDASRLIQCHGSFATATCQKCGHQVSGDEIHNEIKAGHIPRCSVCRVRAQQIRPTSMKRKRSSDHRRSRTRRDEDEDSSSEEDFAEEPGVMKPDITFFGENLPDTFHDRLRDTNYDIVDLVIVIGTSLKVAPVAEIPNFVSGQNETIPQIYISRDPCEHIAFDIELLGECDVVIAEMCRRAGWEMIHEMAIPKSKGIDVVEADNGAQWVVAVREQSLASGGSNGEVTTIP